MTMRPKVARGDRRIITKAMRRRARAIGPTRPCNLLVIRMQTSSVRILLVRWPLIAFRLLVLGGLILPCVRSTGPGGRIVTRSNGKLGYGIARGDWQAEDNGYTERPKPGAATRLRGSKYGGGFCCKCARCASGEKWTRARKRWPEQHVRGDSHHTDSRARRRTSENARQSARSSTSCSHPGTCHSAAGKGEPARPWGNRTESERVAVVDRVAVSVPVEVQPTRQPDRVFLREMDGFGFVRANQARRSDP
jgi:hypothetical protein